MDEEILNALIKRAKGYTYNEVQEEYSVDESGEIALTKRKVMEKYCPPDSTALKTYLDICGDDDISSFSDEELIKERDRLLKMYCEQQLKGGVNIKTLEDDDERERSKIGIRD